MTMFNKDQIFQLLESRDGEALRALWQGRGAVDIAALLDSVEDSARQAAVFRTLPKDLAADVFSYLPGPTQATLARSFADGELQQIFDALHLDDAADFLEELPANLVTRILRSASPQRRMAVNALLHTRIFQPPYHTRIPVLILIPSSVSIFTESLQLPLRRDFDFFPFAAVAAFGAIKIPLHRISESCTRQIYFTGFLRSGRKKKAGTERS